MDNPPGSAVNPSSNEQPLPPAEPLRTARKYALVIGNTEYSDPGLARLNAPGRDAHDFARVLREPKLCAFDDVKAVIDHASSTVIEAIDEFFDDKKPDDLLVLYFSGHGIRDEYGALYLAFKNTLRTRLRSSAIKADYIREAMDQSRSKRQILILDCCNSGAFPQGTKGAVGGSMGLLSALQGYGRYVLTASDATQFAWEGDRVIGQTENSLFTHYLIKGLEGEADQDGDGRITVDDLYDYTFTEISQVIPNQTPTKSASKQAGDITLRQITHMEDIKPRALPDDLAQALADPRTFVREGAVEQLEVLLHGKNLGWVRSAKEALEQMAVDDDSFRVRQAARRALGPPEQPAPAVIAPPPQPEPQLVSAPSLDAAPIAVTVAPLPPPPAVAKAETTTAATAEPAAPRASVRMPHITLPPRRMLLGGAGVFVGLVGIIATAMLLTSKPNPMGKPPAATLTALAGPTQALSTAPAASPLATTGALPVTGPTQADASQPATSLPVTHLMQPANVSFSGSGVIYDTDSSGTGPEGRAPYGDSYAVNRFERPFQKNMLYVPDMDILSFALSSDADWDYVSMQLAGSNPNNALGIRYGVEADLNGDGYGDYLIAAAPPYSGQWTTSNVQVLKDTNHDTAAWISGNAAHGDGYDTIVFDGASGKGDDLDLAWVRMVQGTHASIQFAFKKSDVGASFVWGAVADAGLKDASKFDYRNWFTEKEAGSPVRASQYYPLGSLYAVDNTCWVANGSVANANPLKLCPAASLPSVGGKGNGSGGSCPSTVKSCKNGYDPVTCLCK